MGQPKAWLQLNGEHLLTRLVRLSVEAGANQVVVVAGSLTDPALVTPAQIQERLPKELALRIQTTVGRPNHSPIESSRQGLSQVPPSHRLLLWPIDCPFADSSLLHRLLTSFKSGENYIARPAFGLKHGHPILLGQTAHGELHSSTADHGAHGIVRLDPSRLLDIRVEDPRLVADLNTPAQATALKIELTSR